MRTPSRTRRPTAPRRGARHAGGTSSCRHGDERRSRLTPPTARAATARPARGTPGRVPAAGRECGRHRRPDQGDPHPRTTASTARSRSTARPTTAQMPAWKGTLTHAQIADVITYIRTRGATPRRRHLSRRREGQECTCASCVTEDAEAIAAIYAPIVTGTAISFETAAPGAGEIRRRSRITARRGRGSSSPATTIASPATPTRARFARDTRTGSAPR